MKSFSEYRKQKGGKIKSKRKRRSVSIKSARNIFKNYVKRKSKRKKKL